MANEHEEERLRQLLRDDGWSLPAWPDTEARVRRAARRQRLATAGASTVAGLLAAAAIVLPLKLIGPPPRPAAATGPQPAATHPGPPTPSATQDNSMPPPVGAAGFPADIYPPPRTRLTLSRLGYCPGGVDVQPFQPTDGQKAIDVLKKVGHPNSLNRILQVTDRTLWPAILKQQPPGYVKQLLAGPAGPIAYAGPLEGYVPFFGPGAPTATIAHYCGSWLALSTWLIVTGPASDPKQQSKLFFIDRAGHVLLYFWE